MSQELPSDICLRQVALESIKVGTVASERVPVEVFELTVRALNCLKANDIDYVDQVVISALHEIQNMTSVQIEEIRRALLRFHGIDPDEYEGSRALVPRR
jgi:DNA-directed RNA polymerase alpha subunit